MRKWQAIVALLPLLGWTPHVAAEEERAPRSVGAVADEVSKASAAKDDAALEALSAKDDPDPWLVADELCFRGEHDTATAFARAAPRKDVERLPAYVDRRRGRPPDDLARRALPAVEQAVAANDHASVLRLSETCDVPAGTATRIYVCHQRARAYRDLRRFEEGASLFRDVAEAAERIGWWMRAELAHSGSGYCSWFRSDYRAYLKSARRRLALAEARGNREGVARSHRALGLAYARLGNLGKALSYQKRTRDLWRALDDPVGVATALLDLGGIAFGLGRYPESLAHQEEALTLWREQGHRIGESSSLANLGLVHAALGDHARALACHEQSLAILEEEEYDRIGATLKLVGTTHQALGNHTEALRYFERALEREEAWGRRAGVASALAALGSAHFVRGDHEKALEHLQEALDRYEALGSKRGVGFVQGEIGCTYFRLGRHEIAMRHLESAVRVARRCRQPAWLVGLLSIVAQVHLAAGDPGRALAAAREALPQLETLLGGLGEEEAASARGEFAALFAVGALAAARRNEPAEVLEFLETGRAGALLESLGGRHALPWSELPEELLHAESEALRRVARARRAYQEAHEKGTRKEIRARGQALDEALDTSREAAARIQREAKRQAGMLYPRVAPLEELQGWLGDGQALVLYGLCLDEALALLVTSDASRVVSLGTRREVEAACTQARQVVLSSAVRGPMPDGGTEPDAAAGAAAIRRLRLLLVDPLAPPAEVDTVLVSPEGPLCYLPFGALFDCPVAVSPSGTTHVLLREEETERGENVLALGDPLYRRTADAGAAAIYRRVVGLVPLPATRAEAISVGDVTLLGEDASEQGFRDALAKRDRWRAVHLACHGLVDPDRPTLSSLALSRAGEDDGFLTALEVIRMEIPADLAVLSACETAKGKVVSGEGIVGLTRAFMYAGAPRVLCSLWRVDDEATRALMTKFYALWNPDEGMPMSAAEALREAQAHVRSQEKWRHPYYWGAWVLWGLPE